MTAGGTRKKVMHCSGTFLEEWGGAMGLFSCPLFKRPAIKKALRVYKGNQSFWNFADEIKKESLLDFSHEEVTEGSSIDLFYVYILAYPVCHLGFSCI